MTPTHVVLRPIDAGGKRLPGEMVDARTWRHVEYFTESRRLRPVFVGEEPVECDCGRLWTSEDEAGKHGCAEQPRQPEERQPVAVVPAAPLAPPGRPSGFQGHSAGRPKTYGRNR